MATSPSYTKVHHEVSLDGTLDLEEAPMQEISLQKTSYAQMDEGDTLLIAADDLVSHSESRDGHQPDRLRGTSPPICFAQQDSFPSAFVSRKRARNLRPPITAPRLTDSQVPTALPVRASCLPAAQCCAEEVRTPIAARRFSSACFRQQRGTRCFVPERPRRTCRIGPGRKDGACVVHGQEVHI